MVAYRQRWSSEEEAALEAGVDKYGEGKWTRILKDRKFGPVLHLRSNVDLKDKWRNIVLMKGEIARHKIRGVQKSTRKILNREKKSRDPDFVGASSRNGDRGGLKSTRKIMKRRTINLSEVISCDPKVVVRNPLKVLSGRSKVSELDSIKKTTSRLDNPMVDAITKGKESCESSRTTVPTYLEKGKWVEVLTREEGFSDCWYMATVIDTPPQNSDFFASFEKYYVEYETLKDDDDNCQLKEFVDAQVIRPLCPILSVDSLQVGDIVDAYYYDGWWIGTVTKALPNSRFGITFPPPVTEQEFHISELRIHLDWINGHWINPNSQSREADNDDSYSRPVKKFRTLNIEEIPATTACETGTLNPNSSSNQSTSLANKTTKENKFSELDTDTPDIEKRSRRPPNIHKSSTNGNGSNVGLRTAGGIKEKDCGTIINNRNSQGNVPEGFFIEKNMEIATEFNEKAQPIVSSAKLVSPSSEFSHSIVVGVRTSEGRDCETEDIAPILVDLTCDETISPHCNIPCQAPPEGDQTFVIDQNNQGSVPERIIIENRAAELQFTVRENVEVSFEKENYNVWFPATVLKSFPDNSYLVHFVCKKGQEVSPHSATVSLPHIRPKPPQHKSKSFELLDKVDAFHGYAWTRGNIIKEYIDKRFMVSFNRKKTKLFSKNKLRPHMDWVDGRWIDASKSREAENDASNLRLSKKPKTIKVAKLSTPTACEKDTMSSKLSSKQVMKEKKSSEPDLNNPTIVKRSGRPPKILKSLTNGNESNTGVINSPLFGLKCSLWDCTRPSAQGFDHCSNHHAELALKEGTLGMNPVLRPGGTGVKESLFFVVLNAKAHNKDVGIPECDRATTAKSPWNAPELFDINVLEGETVREWLFFDKPRKAFKNGNRKQLSLPDYHGRGWHESRKQVMNEFNAQKKSYYMDPQPSKEFEWHLYEYEIFNFDACVLYRLEYKRVGDKKSTKGKSPNDSVAYLQKQMEIPTDGSDVRYPGVRIADRTEESDFEMEDISPIPNELPSNGTRTPQHNISCQFPPERSETYISDQICCGNVSARFIIEESVENSLSKLRDMSPGLSEARSRITIPTESPHSIVDGVRAVEGREEEDCETGGIAPIFIDLTSDGTISPQHNSHCQLSPERSGTLIFDQNGEGHFPARLVIEENAENSLTDQMRTSQKLLEPRNMMEVHIENDSCVTSSDKAVKHYVRKRQKRNENPCSESPHLSVHGAASSKETVVHNVAENSSPSIDHDVNQVLPFKKTLSFWDIIESMEEFRLFPQRPHFRSLENIDDIRREGVALSQMVTFSKIVKDLTEMGIEMPQSSKEKCLENLIALEENGFDVRNIRDRLKFLEEESRVMELKIKKRKIDEDVGEIDKLLKELQEKRVAAMSKIEIRNSATEASRSLLNNINDRMNRIKFDFEEMVAARW